MGECLVRKHEALGSSVCSLFLKPYCPKLYLITLHTNKKILLKKIVKSKSLNQVLWHMSVSLGTYEVEARGS